MHRRCSVSTRRPTGRTRSTRPTGCSRETNCYTDIWIELLHALGLRAARDARRTARRSTSRATSGRSSSRRRPISSALRRARSTSSRCTAPLPEHVVHAARARPCRDRRGRRVLPARHAAASYQRDSTRRRSIGDRGDRHGRERLRYFHNAGLLRARRRRLPRRAACGSRLLGRRPAAVRRARAHRPADTVPSDRLERSRPSCSACSSRAGRHDPVARFGERLAADLPRCSTETRRTTRTRSRPSASAAPRGRPRRRSSSGSTTQRARTHRRRSASASSPPLVEDPSLQARPLGRHRSRRSTRRADRRDRGPRTGRDGRPCRPRTLSV